MSSPLPTRNMPGAWPESSRESSPERTDEQTRFDSIREAAMEAREPMLPAIVARSCVRPLVSVFQPSEPPRSTLNPDLAQYQPFYHDLIRAMTDMIVITYRSQYKPKKSHDDHPGMYVLQWQRGSDKGSGLMRVHPKDLYRPVLDFDADFYISACEDHLSQPVPKFTGFATPASRVPRAGPPLPLMMCRKTTSSFLSTTPAAKLQQHQEEWHRNHVCVDIERLATEFMWWFLCWRARIPRKIPPEVREANSQLVRLYISMLIKEHEDEKSRLAEEYAQALYNLGWEIKHPTATRPGASNPNGTPLRHPWIHGDEYIHSTTRLTSSPDWLVALRLRTNMLFARKDHPKGMTARRYGWCPNLFSILERKAAPHVPSGLILDFENPIFGKQKSYRNERELFEDCRKWLMPPPRLHFAQGWNRHKSEDAGPEGAVTVKREISEPLADVCPEYAQARPGRNFRENADTEVAVKMDADADVKTDVKMDSKADVEMDIKTESSVQEDEEDFDLVYDPMDIDE